MIDDSSGDAMDERTSSPSAKGTRLRLLRGAAAVVLTGLSLYYLGTRIAQGADDLRTFDWRVDWLGMAGSLGLSFASVLLGAWAWNLVLLSFGQNLGLGTNVRNHLYANIAKYLPGFAWQLVGKAYLTREKGVETRTVAVAIGVEFGLLIDTGLFLAALILPPVYVPSALIEYVPVVRWGVVLASGLVAIGLPWIARAWMAFARRRGFRHWNFEVRPKTIWSASAAMAVGWLLLGLSLHLLLGSLYTVKLQVVPSSIFTLIVSFLISLAVVVVPTGIGVREGAMAYLLGVVTPASIASVIAILSRLVLILSELMGFVMAVLLRANKNAK